MTSPDQPEYAPIPPSALGPALNEQGYYVGRVERNLFWVTDSVYNCAFLATRDGVVLFDAPPSIGGNLRRAIDQIAAAEGVPNTVTHFVYSHHHADHNSAAFLFGGDVVRIGHEETLRLLRRDDDEARPLPDLTFADSYTLEVGGDRVELAWHGPNHTPDNIYIHFPGHDTLMFIDVVNAGWVPIYNVNLSEDVTGYMGAPQIALSYPWTQHVGRGQGPPRRGGGTRRRAGHREVHRRAGRRGHRGVHHLHDVPDHAVLPPGPRAQRTGSSLSTAHRGGHIVAGRGSRAGPEGSPGSR